MREFTLKQREPDYLKLNIGEESFNIPLATDLTMEEAESMQTTEGTINYFKKHIPEEIANTFTIRNWTDLINEWKNASQDARDLGGVSPGES